DSLDAVQAWRTLAQYKEARKIGDKYAKFRSLPSRACLDRPRPARTGSLEQGSDRTLARYLSVPGPQMQRSIPSPVLLRALFVTALAAGAAPLAGCHDFGDVTGSIPVSGSQPTDEARLRAYTDELGKRYDRNPGEKTASIEYARALRALT